MGILGPTGIKYEREISKTVAILERDGTRKRQK